MNTQNAVEYLSEIAKKSDAEQFDILAGSSNSSGVSIYNGALQNTEISNSCGIGIRVFKNQKPGYASTEKFSKESLAQTLADALSNSEWTEPINAELPSPVPLSNSLNTYNPDLENIKINHLLSTCLDIEKRVLSQSEIKNVPDLGAEISDSSTIFANSKGVFFEDYRNSFGIGCGAVAERNGIVKMGWYSKAGRDFKELSVEHFSEKVVKRARELLSPKPIKGAKMPVVFSKRISGSILSMYFSSFYAENAQKGLSRLKGKIGESIASKDFSLLSDPLNPALPGSILMDGEGIPTAVLSVVEQGCFKSFLYNIESASKENRKSTGNGVRGFAGKAGTSFFNTVVPLGKNSTEELLAMFPSCLLINHLEGGSGCNPVSGEISIGAQGFWCENGVQAHAVDNITLSANFFDLLKNIAGIGNEYGEAFSSVQIPSFAVSEIAVSA
ncbi:MAG: TldD/PmbA family protein [Fibromonadaceae bacterium]|jgi:PmbA protein|nr:TldD/PmbA family protein [Fibromonadaceae bacterium]